MQLYQCAKFHQFIFLIKIVTFILPFLKKDHKRVEIHLKLNPLN